MLFLPSISFLIFFNRPGRNNRESHQSFADQSPFCVSHIAINNAGRPSLTQDARVRLNLPVLDGLQEINFHFDRHHARVRWRSQNCGESPGRIGQHRQHTAVNDALNLFMQFKNVHAEDRSARLGAFQHKSKMIDWIAVAQPFGDSRQCGLAQFSRGSHLPGLPSHPLPLHYSARVK